MQSSSVPGLRVVASGGLGVLGAAVVARLVAGGCQVAVLARESNAVEPPKGSVLIAPAELSDEVSTRAALARAAAALGGVDALVNLAGGFAWESFEQASITTWQRQFDINLRTTLLTSQAALPHLLASPHGSVVNVAAAGALKAGAGMGAYAAAKSGVMRLTEAMAEEFKTRGLRVNAVLPSIIDTAANRVEMPDADFSRWVRAEELAEVIAFLVSPAASGITGALIPVVGRV